jgi:hypothetical protein
LLMFFPKESILLFFFRFADVFPQWDLFAVLLQARWCDSPKRLFCCSSLGLLMFFPKESILLFFFRFADVFPQRDLFTVLLQARWCDSPKRLFCCSSVESDFKAPNLPLLLRLNEAKVIYSLMKSSLVLIMVTLFRICKFHI